MTKPKLKTKTPDNPDTNSLIMLHDDVIANPTERRMAIVEFITTDVNYPVHGDTQASIQLDYIEVLTGKDKEDALKIANRRFHGRTGQKTRVIEDPTPDTPLDLSELDDSVDDAGPSNVTELPTK